jgi:hypothetical protein
VSPKSLTSANGTTRQPNITRTFFPTIAIFSLFHVSTIHNLDNYGPRRFIATAHRRHV